MASLRCNECVHLNRGFCSKIGEALPNRLAQLFYGGAVSVFSGTLTYPSKCGIEKEARSKTELELILLSSEDYFPRVVEKPID